MITMENVELVKAKQRIEKASSMFSLAVSEIDVNIAVQEQILAEMILRKIIGEMKEREAKK